LAERGKEKKKKQRQSLSPKGGEKGGVTRAPTKGKVTWRRGTFHLGTRGKSIDLPEERKGKGLKRKILCG